MIHLLTFRTRLIEAAINSVFEMAVVLSQYNVRNIDATRTVPVISANLSGLDGLDTSNLWKLTQSVGFSLADSEWIGDDLEVREKSERLQRQLNQMISERTSVFEVPEHLVSEFHPKELPPMSCDETETYELRKAPSNDMIFLCAKDSKNRLTGFRKFNCPDDLEEAIWE